MLEQRRASARRLPHYSYPLFPTGVSMAKLIFGCGYLGLRVARLWRAAGEAVYAVTRSADRAEELAAEGLKPIVADVTGASPVAAPQGIETVLWAVGYSKAPTGGWDDGARGQRSEVRGRSLSQTPDFRPSTIHDVYVGGLGNILRSRPSTVRRVHLHQLDRRLRTSYRHARWTRTRHASRRARGARRAWPRKSC